MVKKVSCRFCASRCGMLVHQKNRRVTKVEGDPEHLVSRGWTCARGRAAVARRYYKGLN